MVLIYRGMLLDITTNKPQVGDTAGNLLGVRTTGTNPDVVTYLAGGVPWVSPTNGDKLQGVSVSPNSGCYLPDHRRPKGPPWNGKNGNTSLKVWVFNTDDLVANQLAYVEDLDDAEHAFLSPGIAMPLTQYRQYIHNTAIQWNEAPTPDPECSKEGVAVTGTQDRVALIDSAVASGKTDSLINELRNANTRGVSRTTLIAELQEGVDRAEAAGQEEGAETLRLILDRVTGFCAPHLRITLD